MTRIARALLKRMVKHSDVRQRRTRLLVSDAYLEIDQVPFENPEKSG